MKRLPENLEVLFLLVFGIFEWKLLGTFSVALGLYFQLLQMTDGSPFTMKERWMMVWDTELPVEYFSQFVQKIIKTVLSVIVVVRCATTYAYVVSAMLVIFCLLKDSAPKLMLLWLLIAGLKSVLLTFLEALAGVYVCSAFGQIRKACVEFVVSKALEIIFAAYLWGSILNIYQEMERQAEETQKPEIWEQLLLQKGECSRQRARSLLDESTLYKTSCLNNFEFKDVPQIILQMLKRKDELSRDSLLDSGMMLASVSNMGSFDNLKTSQSLGELGFVDLRSAQVVGLEDDETLSPQDKALKFLKLTWSDVRRAQRNKTALESDIYKIDKDTWRQVVAGGTHINRPKEPRAEVFMREIQQMESEEYTRKPRKRSFDLKFSWSFLNFYAGRHASLQEADDEQYEEYEDEEREENEEPTPLFMSNIKEEVVVNRIRLDFVSKKMKGDAYAQLYKQDYMNLIGPEVFDKATKLQKVTVLTKIRNYSETLTSMSLPAFSETAAASGKKINFSNDSEEKIYRTSSSELDFTEFRQPNMQDVKTKTEFTGKTSKKETDSVEDRSLMDSSFHSECDKISTCGEEKLEQLEKKETATFLNDKKSSEANEKFKKESSEPSPALSREFSDHTDQTSPFCRRRIINIRRIGRQTTGTASSTNQNFLKISETCCGHQPSPNDAPFGQEKSGKHKKSEMLSSQSSTSPSFKGFRTGRKSVLGDSTEQIYFLTDLFQKPPFDALVTHNDSKRVQVRKNSKKWDCALKEGLTNFQVEGCEVREYNTLLHPPVSPCESEERNWKSEVLKRVEAHRKKSSQVIFSDITQSKSIARKLLAYYLQKYDLARMKEQVLLSLFVANDCGWANFNGENFSNSALGSLEESIDLLRVEKKLSFCKNLKCSATATSCRGPSEEHTTNSATGSSSGKENIDSICRKLSKVTLPCDENLQLSNCKIFKSDTNFEKLKSKDEGVQQTEAQENLDLVSTSEVFEGIPEEESVCSQESEEPISLYYSKAANLASPLLDVKRFIYPDHIHYSYKHVKKKGFDVDISGGFPLLVRESLTMSTPLKDSVSTHPEFAITRRPMDLSFATTNAFTEWQNNDQSDVEFATSEIRSKIDPCPNKKERKPSVSDFIKNKKAKKGKRSKKTIDKNGSHVSLRTEAKLYQNQNFSNYKHLYSSKDYLLIEKLLRMHMRLNSKEYTEFRSHENERTPIQISSTQLHSNKGRRNSTYNPAIFLQENKTRSEKKKVETQEERTKDMFARLEREALLQSKNVQRSSIPFRRI